MGMGFRFCRSQGMEGSTGNLREFAINPANTDPIFTGDLVALNGGYIEEASGGSADETAVNSLSLLGIFQGCRYTEADGSFKFSQYWDGLAGKTGVFAHVAIPSAGATMMVAGDPESTYAVTDIGTLKGVIYNVGVARTGQSRVTLGATGANVAGAPLMVIKQLDIPGATVPWFEVAAASPQLF